jgi:hypothetical protein
MVKRIKLSLLLIIFMSIFVAETFVGVAAAKQEAENIAVMRTLYSEYQYDAFIPQISGINNIELQTIINANLLGIHFIGMSNTKRAAHPNKIDSGIHIDLTTGEIRNGSLWKAIQSQEPLTVNLITEAINHKVRQ